MSTYNITINNSLSSGANGYALVIQSLKAYYKQCPVIQTSSFDFAIMIFNSNFTHNNNIVLDAAVFINLIGVKFTTRIIVQSTEICHNYGFGLKFNFFSYQYKSQFFVTLVNFIANNNSSPNRGDGGIQSAVYAVYVTRLVLNNVSITNNIIMTGLSVYHTAVVVNGTSVFHNNTGIDGGGLAMFVNSYLMFHENSILNFINNSAMRKGGAIFLENQLALAPCFFQYSDHTLPESVKVKITGNKADKAGTVLFGGDIITCYLFHNNLTYGNESFNKTFNYSTQTGPSVISSKPSNVCFCDDNNTINCSQTQLSIKTYPGEETNMSVVAVGQQNGIAPGMMQIKPQDNADTSADIYFHKTSAMNCKTIALKVTLNSCTHAQSIRHEYNYFCIAGNCNGVRGSVVFWCAKLCKERQ